MIINIRGNSGSGKTVLVRRLLSALTTEPFFIPDRTRPAGYTAEPEGAPGLAVMGTYADGIASGGCDNLNIGTAGIFGLIRQRAELGYDVVYEGVLMSEDAKWIGGLYPEFRVTIIRLTTPLEDCIASINLRRARKGKAPVDEKNTRAREKRIDSATNRAAAAGVTVHRLDRVSAAMYLEGLFSVGFPPYVEDSAESVGQGALL